MSDQPNKRWIKNGDRYELWIQMFDWEEKEHCFAILEGDNQKNPQKPQEYTFVTMDFRNDFWEPSTITPINAEGFEKCSSADEAKLIVEDFLIMKIEDLIGDLEKTKGLITDS